MRNFIIVAAAFALLVSAGAQAEPVPAEFTHIELHRVGKLIGNYQSGRLLKKMSEGVKMTFHAELRENNIEVEANSVDFLYAEGDQQMPSTIALHGKVRIKNQNNVIQSDEATINFDSGLAVFTGNARMDSDAAKDLRASKIQMNLKTGDFELSNATITHLDLSNIEDSASPKKD